MRPQHPQWERTEDPQTTARSGFNLRWMWNTWGSRYVATVDFCSTPGAFEDSYAVCLCCLSQIQKMGLQPSDISMFSTLMDLVNEARDLCEQNQ